MSCRAETVGSLSKIQLFSLNILHRIIRVITIVPVFALVSFLCVWQDGAAAQYISPWRDIGEALPMGAFFFLMTAYISPDEQSREEFFSKLALMDKKGVEMGGGSLAWYHVRVFIPDKTKLTIHRDFPLESCSGFL